MPLALRMLARGYVRAGQKQNALKVIDEFERRPYVPAIFVAAIYQDLGQKDDVARWLERAYREEGQPDRAEDGLPR